jgi:hypothetical protein
MFAPSTPDELGIRFKLFKIALALSKRWSKMNTIPLSVQHRKSGSRIRHLGCGAEKITGSTVAFESVLF